ncbi:MAG: hypothetical protein Q9N67_11385 [Ghiorsea sp.]|nr:hypothetical protein [Ghiorsea sp.]
MNLPLYKGADLAQKPASGHAGLHGFDRFFNRYDEDWKVPKDERVSLAG